MEISTDNPCTTHVVRSDRAIVLHDQKPVMQQAKIDVMQILHSVGQGFRNPSLQPEGDSPILSAMCDVCTDSHRSQQMGKQYSRQE